VTGSSASAGSWKIIENGLAAERDSSSSSSASTRAKHLDAAEICVRFFGNSRISARRVTLCPNRTLPEGQHFPSPRKKLRSFTACTCARRKSECSGY